MKLTAVLLVAACLNVGAFSSAQEITLSEKGASLQKIFRQIHHQTGYQFFYEDELLDKAGKIDIHVEKASLDETLTRCFERLDLSYVIVNKTIVVNVRKRDMEASRSLPPAPIRKPVLPIDVSGKVVMENGEPAIGVTVAVKGTFIGTFTDENGRYALENINDNDTLVFSAVNILTIEAPVAGRTVVDVVVRSSISVLDEVQVIGYGITTRRLQTGSVGTVKSQILERQPVANPLQALQGRIAGVSITQTAGAIGSGVEIQVRGVNTIESGNQPLIIVDGAVMPDPNRGLGTSVGSYMPWGSSSMTNLNSADIESIEILKDADATSICWVREERRGADHDQKSQTGGYQI
ncbi:MAG: TonB-dependent receptor plug domain-containing protein [Haliscomenobacter sp.]|nr:TonB-dependent receptor plug domain-containing protein [Haliscomenobacter sp.]